MIEHKFNCGDRLKDSVTGFEGVVMAMTYYATDCLHYGLQTDTLKDGKPIDWEWLDETRMILVKAKAVKFQREKPTSGPGPKAPSRG